MAESPIATTPPVGQVVQVYARGVYGKMLIYPSNVLAGQLAAFAGSKTFTLTHLQQLRAMGFTIEQVADHQASQALGANV